MTRLKGLILLLLLPLVAHGDEPLQGGISQSITVDQAREEALQHAPSALNLQAYSPQDADCEANLSALRKGSYQVADRHMMVFWMPNGLYYSVTREGDPHTFYYTFNCLLLGFALRKGAAYPVQEEKFSYPTGKQVSITLYSSPTDAFSFLPNGSLLGHWQGNLFWQAGEYEGAFP